MDIMQVLRNSIGMYLKYPGNQFGFQIFTIRMQPAPDEISYTSVSEKSFLAPNTWCKYNINFKFVFYLIYII